MFSTPIQKCMNALQFSNITAVYCTLDLVSWDNMLCIQDWISCSRHFITLYSGIVSPRIKWIIFSRILLLHQYCMFTWLYTWPPGLWFYSYDISRCCIPCYPDARGNIPWHGPVTYIQVLYPLVSWCRRQYSLTWPCIIYPGAESPGILMLGAIFPDMALLPVSRCCIP